MCFRLCGGTYLTLISAVMRNDANREISLGGTRYSLSDTGIATALMRIMNSQYKVAYPGSFKVALSRFKNCRTTHELAVPVNESIYADALHSRILSDFKEVQAEMNQLIHAFLQFESSKQMTWLASMLIDTIASDRFIPAEAICCYSCSGQAITKRDLIQSREVFLPGLLIGALDYISLHVDDNSVGQETLDAWSSEKESVNQRRVIRSNLVSPSRSGIVVYIDPPEESIADPQTEEKPPVIQETAQQPTNQLSSPAGTYHQETINQSIYGGMVFNSGSFIQSLNWFGQGSGKGTSLFELQQLRRDYYSLIVLDGETLTDQHFAISHKCLFNEGTDEKDKEWLMQMSDETKELLINCPTIFASVNPGPASAPAYQMAILGRITGFRIQRYDIRIEWKAFCPIQQNLLNSHCPELEIYYSNLSNELDVEHWAVKPIPLLDRLFAIGVNPYALVS